MKFLFLYFLTIFLSLSSLNGQAINQVDDKGERHGLWQKNYDGTSQLRYEGTFEHGKEIGTFKFYCEDCKDIPIAIKEFEANSDISYVKYYAPNGKLVSEGKMDVKKRVGEWLYYHKESSKVMTREFYKDGKLDGQKITYYLNDIITEETTYVDGLREGLNNYYSPDGILLKKLQYKNDVLIGAAIYYDSAGNVSIEGNYKNGKKHGLWKYYKNGKLIREELFPKSPKKIKN